MTLPTISVQFSPTTGPFDTPTWIELGEGGPHGNRVEYLEWTDGKQADLDEYGAGEARIVLRSHDRLFDPDYTAGTYFGDLNPRVPFRIRATYSAVTYDMFYGFVEDGWEQALKPPGDGLCTVKLTDLIGLIAGNTLPSVLEAEVLADSPVAYWPLEERTGTVVDDLAADFDGTDEEERTFTQVATVDGFPREMLTQPGLARILVPEIETVKLAAGLVVEVLCRFDGADAAYGNPVVFGTGNNAQAFEITYTPTNDQLIAIVYDVANAGTISTQDLTDAVHHLAYRLPAAGSAFMYVDGVDATSSNWSDSVGITALTPGTSIGGRKDMRFWNGPIGHVAVFHSDIGTSRIAAHASAAIAPLDGLRSDEQIEWALGQVGVPSTMYDLDAGVAIMGPVDTDGLDALEFMRQVTRTEQGDLYVAHHDGGKLRFRSRYASFLSTRSTVTQATFSDDGTAADSTCARVIPDTLVIEPNSPATIINRAAVGWRGGEEIVDVSSGSPYGPRGVDIQTQAPTSAAARGIGQWITSLHADPRARVKQLGIDPGANHAEFPVALGTRILDRAAYRSHPNEVGSATTKALEVLGRHHAVEGVSWLTTYYLTEHPDQGVELFVLGTSQLDGADILAY